MRYVRLTMIAAVLMWLVGKTWDSWREAAANTRAAHDVRPGDMQEAGNFKALPMELQEGIRTGHRIPAIRWVMEQDHVGVAVAKSRVAAIERLLHAEDI